MHNRNLQLFGLSILFLALAMGSLSRTMHTSDTVKNAMSGISILLSLTATGLFIKAAPPQRRVFVIVFMLVAMAALAALTYLFLYLRLFHR